MALEENNLEKPQERQKQQKQEKGLEKKYTTNVFLVKIILHITAGSFDNLTF